MTSTLVLGGARSGKTNHALRLAEATSGALVMIATAQALDDEMVERIARHQAERGPRWRTIEAPLELGVVIDALKPDETAVVDCLTLWLSNLMFAEKDLDAEAIKLEAAIRGRNVILVSNEVGLGIVPDNALARQFRDAAGRLNQRIAGVADRVVFVAAGMPMVLKG